MNEQAEDQEEVLGHIPDDPLTGHAYDGIQEFDNPLPGWWKWLFILSILFAFPYMAYYHGGAKGRTSADRFDRALAENMRLQFAEIGELKEDRATVVRYLYDPSWLRVGQTVYKTHCVSCHGAEGGGLVGPNLTDEHYKNVSDIADILTVLQNGAAGGAMPAWKTRLSSNEIVLVSSYVASLRGKNVSGGKTEEGRVIPPWPASPVEGDLAEELAEPEPTEPEPTEPEPAGEAPSAEETSATPADTATEQTAVDNSAEQ